MKKEGKISENLDKIKKLILEVFPDVKQVSLYGNEEGYICGKDNAYLTTLVADREFTFIFKKLSDESKS